MPWSMRSTRSRPGAGRAWRPASVPVPTFARQTMGDLGVPVRVGSSFLPVVAGCIALVALMGSAAAAADCATEETALMKEESELPRLEVASPADRPITCITLETIIAFAGRLKAHVAHCPASSYTAIAADWEKTRADYGTRF